VNSELRIRTPEGIVFSYALAGPVTRCLACTIDVFIALGMERVAEMILKLVGVLAPDFSQGLAAVAYLVITIGYGMLFEWLARGQTLGKKMLRLRVMDARGLRLQLHQVVIRNLLRFVDMLPAFYMLGGIVSILSPRGQRLGDLAAGTIVVHNPVLTEPDLDQLLAGKFNSLRQYPHLEARLRQRVTPSEARLALRALVRRDELEPAARVKLFCDLATHFKALVTFPAEITDALPDEQYIRNIVDILFRTRQQAAEQVVEAAT
jgi:uncharacterized RDD family membrane protein YckC